MPSASERLVGAATRTPTGWPTPSTEGPFAAEHHHASAQVLPAGEGRSRFVWITDVLPDDLADTDGGTHASAASRP